MSSLENFVYAMSLGHQEIRKSVAIEHGVKISGAERVLLGGAQQRRLQYVKYSNE